MQKMTAGQLAELPDDAKRYELIDGVLHMMTPAGFEHGRIAMRLGSRSQQHVRADGLGVVCAAETGFLLSKDPDTVLAPDVAFVRQRHVEQLARVSGYPDLAPDLVAEVISPSDRYTDVERKALAWLDAGAQVVLVVDPDTRITRVYRSADMSNTVSLSGDQQIDVPAGFVQAEAGSEVTPIKQEPGKECLTSITRPESGDGAVGGRAIEGHHLESSGVDPRKPVRQHGGVRHVR
jgi:Uma2 family endonuclease